MDHYPKQTIVSIEFQTQYYTVPLHPSSSVFISFFLIYLSFTFIFTFSYFFHLLYQSTALKTRKRSHKLHPKRHPTECKVTTEKSALSHALTRAPVHVGDTRSEIGLHMVSVNNDKLTTSACPNKGSQQRLLQLVPCAVRFSRYYEYFPPIQVVVCGTATL